ncbi:MAG: lipopolysaccharide kinase InaA family protein [Lentisphaeria bacterium]|nr:lipopolysaccharide kinase InaA family protein [Lentisphaeria bacterium]
MLIIWLDKKLRAASCASCFSSLDGIFSLSGLEVSSGRCSRMLLVELEGQKYYVKLSNRGGKRLRRWLGRSRLESEYLNLRRFASWGMPCPRVLAFALQKRFGIFRRAALVTEPIEQALDLVQWAELRPQQFDDAQWLHKVSSQLASACRSMHKRNFAHGDLKWRNILVKEGDEAQVYFIDCPDGRFWVWPFMPYRIVKDLACLDKIGKKMLSKTERLRFFLQYRQEKKLNPKSKRQLRKILRFFEGRE